jgi:AraC family transcriptional regulator
MGMKLKLKAGEFYGTTSHSLSANGLRFTEKSYSSRARLPTHAHELPHFCFVLAGSYHETIAGTVFERAPAALVYYPPDVSHAEEHATRGRHFLVEIDFNRLETMRDYGARLAEPALLGGDSPLWLAHRMYKEFNLRDEFSALALQSLTTELLIGASRQEQPKPERTAPLWFARVKECLRESFSSPPSLDQLARAANVHPTHLARVFRQFEHRTVGDYIREVRVDFARERMLHSDDRLVDIALEAGFADQTHFTRSFKRITGMTPTEYRRLYASR